MLLSFVMPCSTVARYHFLSPTYFSLCFLFSLPIYSLILTIHMFISVHLLSSAIFGAFQCSFLFPSSSILLPIPLFFVMVALSSPIFSFFTVCMHAKKLKPSVVYCMLARLRNDEMQHLVYTQSVWFVHMLQ